MTQPSTVTADIDQFDLKILAALHDRGRMKKVELSEAVNLSPTPSCLRLGKLERSKLIRGYHADIDFGRLANFSQYVVMVSIIDYTPDRARQLEVAISNIPYIIECESVLGSIDYILRVLASSVDHYSRIIEPLLQFELNYTTLPVSRAINKPWNRSILDFLVAPQLK